MQLGQGLHSLPIETYLGGGLGLRLGAGFRPPSPGLATSLHVRLKADISQLNLPHGSKN